MLFTFLWTRRAPLTRPPSVPAVSCAAMPCYMPYAVCHIPYSIYYTIAQPGPRPVRSRALESGPGARCRLPPSCGHVRTYDFRTCIETIKTGT